LFSLNSVSNRECYRFHRIMFSGRLQLAEPLYQRALAISEKALGPDRADMATFLGNYAFPLRRVGRARKKRCSSNLAPRRFGPNAPRTGNKVASSGSETADLVGSIRFSQFFTTSVSRGPILKSSPHVMAEPQAPKLVTHC
jgi:hypothetical protein